MKRYLLERCLVIILLFSLSIGWSFAGEINKVYSIQVFAGKNQQEAQNFANRLSSEGYAPVALVQKGEWWKVLTGEFSVYPDALYFKNALKKGAFPDAFIYKQDAVTSGPLKKISEQNLKIDPVFKDAVKKTWKSVTTKSLAGTEMSSLPARYSPVISEILNATTGTIAIERLRDIKQQNANTEMAGEAALRISYLHLKNKDKAAALQEFEAVAQGNVKASDESRLEAMVRCSNLYHAEKDRVKSLQAFRECSEVADRTSFDHHLHLLIAGLYMELALSEVGKLDYCIRECDQILSQPEGSDESYSTAQVMKGEALYIEKKYEECFDCMTSLLKKYPQEKRAGLVAQLHLGAVLFVKKDYQNAREEFQKVVDNYTDADNWPGKNHRGEAMLYLARTDLAEEKFENAGVIFEKTCRSYKKTKEGDKAKQYLQRYYPQIWENLRREEEFAQ